MTDRERVIMALGRCIGTYSDVSCARCSYQNEFLRNCIGHMHADAFALLEEQPEIVRCKDCKHGAPTIINGVWLSVTCGDIDHRPEWFCADGKRREDDD